MVVKARPAIERFRNKMKPASNGCVEWQGYRLPNGYGHWADADRTHLAHRWIYQYEHNVWLTPDQLILHSCDNRACVNVDHLRVGTAKENTRDMDDRGRRNAKGAVGSSNAKAKLVESDVIEIRSRYRRGGVSVMSLAVEYGMSKSGMALVVNGSHWKHVA